MCDFKDSDKKEKLEGEELVKLVKDLYE